MTTRLPGSPAVGVDAASPARAGDAPQRALPAWRRRDKRSGYLFVAPQVIGTTLFVLAPFLAGVVLAFVKWDGLTEMHWVGMTNFASVLTDPVFLKSILNTVLIALITAPVGLGLAIVIAIGLDRIRGRTVYLICYFAPILTSSVAVSLIWQQLFRADGNLSEAIGKLFGITPPNWLGDRHLVLIAVCIVAIWSSLGLNVVIFLAGLQGISPSVVEAARIDGAGPMKLLTRIRLPLLSPVVFFSTVVAVISSFQTFDTVFILTKDGGPQNAARTIVYHVYDVGFRKFEFGLASAASVVLFILTVIVTLVQVAMQKRFVHYES